MKEWTNKGEKDDKELKILKSISEKDGDFDIDQQHRNIPSYGSSDRESSQHPFPSSSSLSRQPSLSLSQRPRAQSASPGGIIRVRGGQRSCTVHMQHMCMCCVHMLHAYIVLRCMQYAAVIVFVLFMFSFYLYSYFYLFFYSFIYRFSILSFYFLTYRQL